MAEPAPPSGPSEPAPRRPGSAQPDAAMGRRIRSLPDRVRSSTLLADAETAGYGADVSWRRGAAVLWIFFGLIASLEALLLTIYLSAGGLYWPHVNDVFRLTVLCGVFLALWAGWYWARWVLAVMAFFAGGRTVVFILATDGGRAGLRYLTSSELIGSTFYTGLLVLLGTLYLGLAAYLIFSVDVLAFAEHRRKEGRVWVLLPIALLLGVYWITMLGGDFALRRWLAGTRADMEQVAKADVRKIATGWDPASLAAILDDRALQNWPAAGREEFMKTLRPLGTYLVSSDVSARASFDHDPVTLAMQIRGDYQEVMRCTNGNARLSFRLARPLFGEWRVVSLIVGGIVFYDPPTPSQGPAASPAVPPTRSTGG